MVRAENQETLREELIAVFLTKSARIGKLCLTAGVPLAGYERSGEEAASEGQPEARSLLGELKAGDAQSLPGYPLLVFD